MQCAIVHFEIQVDNIERAIEFYSQLFGWKIAKWEGTDMYGIWTGRSKYPNGSVVGMDGGLTLSKGKARTKEPECNGFLCTIEVPNIDDTLSLLEDLGGFVQKKKFSIPGVGWMAVCGDCDGNLFSLIQNDSSLS